MNSNGQMTRMEWVVHFLNAHKHSGKPSAEEMLKYPKAFAEVVQHHYDLHRHFYTGHEHENITGRPIPGRTK